MSQKSLYDLDFYEWTQKTAALIRDRVYEKIDWENLAEEIESLGRSEKRAIASYLVVILTHLLKWQYQPEHQCRSWSASINTSRRQVRKLLKENPSLKGKFVEEALPDAYEEAREIASEETGIYIDRFPQTCPYSVEFILSVEFLP